MTDGEEQALLGLPVWAAGVQLGTVTAVWVDASDTVLGVEVSTTWNRSTYYLPRPAALVQDGVVSASALAFLSTAETGFYAAHGARRIAVSDVRMGYV